MKRIIFLLLLLVGWQWCGAQNCYSDTRSQGIALYNQKKYAEAINHFEVARDCPDKPDENDLADWIQKCRIALEKSTVKGNIVRLPEKEDITGRKNNSLAVEMVFVKGGTFMMGATQEQGSEAESDEKPAHRVTVSDFYIAKYEVTQASWKQVMGNNPSHFRGDDLPVDHVSWDEIQVFLNKINALTGKKFRLPTEAEWEYAARGGVYNKGYKFSGSDDLNRVAWYDDNSAGTTHSVGGKSPNELGIYDMTGNVWEWCEDKYDGNYYSESPMKDPKAQPAVYDYVVRGGGWNAFSFFCRVSNRDSKAPEDRSDNQGFRLVL